MAGRIQCDVSPQYYAEGPVARWFPRMFMDTASGAPLDIAVEVTTTDAFWSDTLLARVQHVPALEQRAAIVQNVQLCRRSEPWTVLSDSVIGAERIAWLRLSGDPLVVERVAIGQVHERRPDHHFRGCPSYPSEVTVAAFLLGTLGELPRSDVEFCLVLSNCRQRLLIDPEKHVLASSPVLSFRLSDLRPKTAAGEQYQLRLHVSRDVEGLVPFVLFHVGNTVEAWPLVRRNARQFDFRAGRFPPFPEETLVEIYLASFRRDPGSSRLTGH